MTSAVLIAPPVCRSSFRPVSPFANRQAPPYSRAVRGQQGGELCDDCLRSRPSTFRTIRAFEWDVADLPRFRQPAGILHSDAYCIAKASDDKDAAWRFVEFANSPEGQEIVARTGRTVPSLKAVAESDAFLDPRARPRSSRVFLDQIETIRRVPTISTWPEIEDAAEGILENGLYLGQDAQRVARELDRTTRPLFARAER